MVTVTYANHDQSEDGVSEYLLRGGRVVDPVNGIDGPMDVLLGDGVVLDVAPSLEPTHGQETIDAEGLAILPGVIDPHVHLSGTAIPTGRINGFRMVAASGVVTVLDMAGDPAELRTVGADGAGLQVMCVVPVLPHHNVTGPDVGRHEADELMERSLADGAIGVKLLGGHYPVTPQGVANLIDAASTRGAYLAIHAGSTRHGSDVTGVKEVIDILDGRPAHLAHINSYCRGQTGQAPADEAIEALHQLEANPNVWSESYLSRYNGASAEVVDGGKVRSEVVARCLRTEGYTPDRDGLVAAIRDGAAHVHRLDDGVAVLSSGDEGAAYWEAHAGAVGISFAANSPDAQCLLALHRSRSGSFTVDALSTDGGVIPRNSLVEQGLLLVRAGFLTMSELVRKTAVEPARWFGLAGKGHLAPGADADVTVVDPRRCRPVRSFGRGRPLMRDGRCVGSGLTIWGAETT